MAKKRKAAHTKPKLKKSFDPENYQYFTPLAFTVIFIALVILFREFIFSNKMLHGSDTIQAGVFFRAFLVDYFLEHGSIPQWNPYIFGGMPYVEAFHGDIFYPLSLLKYFGSIYRMLGWILFIHIFLAGLFMYFTARQLRLSKVASLLSGISYMFASYLISLVSPGHDGKIFVTTLFPLVILFLDRAFISERLFKTFFNFSLLGLIIGVIILSPHPQMSYFTLWVVAFYSLFRIIVFYIKSKSISKLIRPGVLTAYAVVIGLLLSAIQFYPGYLYTSNFSPRADSKKGWQWATSWSLHEEEAFSQLIPEFSGTSDKSQPPKTFYWGKNAFKDNSETVGIVSIFLALMGLFFYRRKETYFFGGLALFVFIYALGATTPFFKIFYYLIPKVKSLRAPSMIMFIFSFSISLLAGMGLQTIIDNSRNLKDKSLKKFNLILLGVPGFMFLLALLFNINGRGMLSLWTSLFYSEASSTMVQAGVSKLDVAYMNLGAIQSGTWLAFLFCALAASFIWLYRCGKAGIGILTVLLLIPIVDSVRFNQRFISTVEPARHWSPNPVTKFFHETDGKYRVMNFISRAIPDDFLPFFGVEMVTGYHGNQLRWYDDLLGGPGKSNQANPRFLNLAGAEYILSFASQKFPENYFGDKPITTAADLGSVQILKNENALPRLFLTDQYRVISDRKEIYPEILNGSEDLQKTVFLEKEPLLEIKPDTLGTDSVWLIDYQIDSILVGISCQQNKILVLTDNYYEAWQVYVDDKQERLHRSYGTFRAVEIPAGTKKVLFKYKSEKYLLGKTVTGATSLYLLFVIGLYVFVNKIKKRENKEK
ncbi:MAG: hypothetical protein ACE5D6_04735 [Candidatus Zixiibacteriota bacterium]